VRVRIDCGEDPGLLVGRDGHTLAAVQYLASRIIARRIGGSLRMQIDAANYRAQQDGRLKELALSLAERAKSTRRPQSTRPLSAYQRRIVHLTLEGDETVQTRSKGEGAQRRVIIQLKRAGRGKEAGTPARDDNPGIDHKDEQPAAADGNSEFSL
jgi:spoIIIJ-associated protein